MCMMFVFLALAVSVGPSAVVGQEPLSQSDACAAVTPQPLGVDLQPGVREFIADSYLSHAAEYPDPNEPVEVLQLYLDGQRLLWDLQVDEAAALFSEAVTLYPDSRHAHAGLGAALLAKYRRDQTSVDLQASVRELVQAADIGMSYGKMRYTGAIAQGFGLLGDEAGLRDFFSRALATGHGQYATHLHFAQGLALLGSAETDAWFQKTIELAPSGNIDAVAFYAEWLLDQGTPERVLEVIAPDEWAEYLHFLRGVALERMGRPDQAREEYEPYIEFSADFPAPSRYRIEGSKAQEGIIFEENSAGEGRSGVLSSPSCLVNISRSIYAEASTETGGAQRAVGWTMRTRIFNQVPGGGCKSFGITGITLCQKYVSAINTGFEACHVTGCRTSPSTDAAASDVYYGRTPQPILTTPHTTWCPSGYFIGCSPCAWPECRCSMDASYGAQASGPLYMWGTSGSCPATHPSNCGQDPWEICSNGGSDNCFYRVP